MTVSYHSFNEKAALSVKNFLHKQFVPLVFSVI